MRGLRRGRGHGINLAPWSWAGQDLLCSTSGSRFYGGLKTPDGLMILANGTIPDRSWLVERRVRSTAVACDRVCVGRPPPIYNAPSPVQATSPNADNLHYVILTMACWRFLRIRRLGRLPHDGALEIGF